jgi:glutamate-1-semialdehyde aminotransferase
VPLTCAAGIAACDTYAGGGPQRIAADRAAALRRLGNSMLAELGVPGRLYSRTVTHIYLGPCDPALPGDGPPSSDPALLANPADAPIHRRLALHLLQRGVASLRGEAFVLSAAHTEADVELTVAALRESLVAMLDEGSLPGS